MKNLNKYFLGLATLALAMSAVSCSDFEDINKSPSECTSDDINAAWFMTNSFRAAQQNPNDNERVFVYNWASITRAIGDNGFGCMGRYSDEYNGCMYNFSSNSIKYATQAILLANEKEAADAFNSEYEKNWNNNVREISRIWRCMVIADFVDCFGPYPLAAFQGVNPKFDSVKDVYYWFFEELADAQSKLVLDCTPNATDVVQDPAFKGDAAKWQKLANSLRMRYAMRLSEVDAAKAKTEFEAAAKTGKYLTAQDELFGFQEYGGWSDWECVYNRSWDDNVISSSMVNLLSGLGGVKVADCYNAITGSTADISEHIVPMDYIGIEYKNHYPANTDNPMNYQWLDGIPENVDPRAFVLFNLPNDETANTYTPGKAGQTVDNHSARGMRNDKGKYVWGKEDATLTFNGAAAGVRTTWCPNSFQNNILVYYSWDTCSFLAKNYNDPNQNHSVRVWFGPWETYFLLAEAAVRGWNAGIGAEAAYNNGVKASFEYLGVGAYADDYLASESYNRVGTSAKFTHTDEPQSFVASYYDGYENVCEKEVTDEDDDTEAGGKKIIYGVVTGRGALKTKTYNYPDASKVLYKGHKLNDQLTKIITQKYIANMPYVLMESWNDRRRLGLPFFEVPGCEMVMSGSDFDNDKKNGYDPVGKDPKVTGQKWNMFVQRMRYPVSLENADPEEYKHALELLGGENFMTTPLWWAIQK